MAWVSPIKDTEYPHILYWITETMLFFARFKVWLELPAAGIRHPYVSTNIFVPASDITRLTLFTTTLPVLEASRRSSETKWRDVIRHRCWTMSKSCYQLTDCGIINIITVVWIYVIYLCYILNSFCAGKTKARMTIIVVYGVRLMSRSGQTISPHEEWDITWYFYHVICHVVSHSSCIHVCIKWVRLR